MTLVKKLKEIEKRAEAATPAPWVNPRNTYDGIAFDELPKGYSSWYLSDKADLEFVAAARTDVPKLVKALRIAVEALKASANQLFYARICLMRLGLGPKTGATLTGLDCEKTEKQAREAMAEIEGVLK